MLTEIALAVLVQAAPPCHNLDDILQSLKDQGMQPTYSGSTYRQQGFLVATGPDGKWAVVLVTPDGCSYVPSAGERWGPVRMAK
jgi:hypothetical protein